MQTGATDSSRAPGSAAVRIADGVVVFDADGWPAIAEGAPPDARIVLDADGWPAVDAEAASGMRLRRAAGAASYIVY